MLSASASGEVTNGSGKESAGTTEGKLAKQAASVESRLL